MTTVAAAGKTPVILGEENLTPAAAKWLQLKQLKVIPASLLLLHGFAVSADSCMLLFVFLQCEDPHGRCV